MIRRTAVIVTSVFFLYSVLMCGPTVPAESPSPDGCGRVIRYQVDTEFTGEQTMAVVQALYEWQSGTDKAICFIPGSGGIKIRKAVDPEAVRALELKGAKYNKGIQPECVVGLAEYPDAWILTDKLKTSQDLYATSVHEVGHLIGLGHYEPEDGGVLVASWMYPSIDKAPHDGSRSITAHDRSEALRIVRSGRR